MYKIQMLNSISPAGLALFPEESYNLSSEVSEPDAILVRSFKMLDMTIPASVKAIARAGAGINNIPVKKCTERGIVVFNTPGANANGVKELVLAGLFLSSRQIYEGITWTNGLAGKGEEVPALVEKGKSAFSGPELKGKKLGIVGLGAIGVMVANDASAMGMDVAGYDPYISIEAAWGLTRNVTRAHSLKALLCTSDYITLHVPLNQSTAGFINRDMFRQMKKGVRLLNFARGELVNTGDLLEAFAAGIVDKYITDFPEERLLKNDKVLCVPHLGASTPESEDNCAVMAVTQVRDFLEKGTIVNAVNFPQCELVRVDGVYRLVVANRNVPAMVGKITAVIAERKINISGLINNHRGDIAYNIIDTDTALSDEAVAAIRSLEGVIMARQVPG